MGAGIDWGMGSTNIDRTNGIRFGVLPVADVLQSWADSSEPVYPDPEPIECDSCGGTGEVEPDDMDGAEPLGFTYAGEGYECFQSGDDSDIFLTRSPFYTRARFCSPCAPGAVYLRDADADGERGYCFGHDWFDGGRAPYPVFRVDTGEEVPPPSV